MFREQSVTKKVMVPLPTWRQIGFVSWSRVLRCWISDLDGVSWSLAELKRILRSQFCFSAAKKKKTKTSITLLTL